MARKTRRGGAWKDYLPSFLGGPTAEERKARQCAAKKEDYDKECGPGEAMATSLPTETSVTAPAPASASAPASSSVFGGRTRRRRATRRKYKGGKHRKGHRA